MDDELGSFIKERKARVAEDKACLEQDPPYMEIKRVYGSTSKENIPPKSTEQRREENCSLGLPLGVEYERKKQRLQHELRMDYRRYMAQKKHLDPAQSGPLMHLNNRRSIKKLTVTSFCSASPVYPHCALNLIGDQTDILPSQQRLLRRDAATLTEGSRGLQRTLHLIEVQPLCTEKDEEQSSVPLRLRDRLGKTIDQESEEDEFFKEDLKGTESRHTRVEDIYERGRSKETDGRDKGETPAGITKGGWRSRALSRKEDAEFATGLIIGLADTKDALQRRKECYRQELQEQIAEQHRNKKREKDLELKVAATGANDPEKQPDRIRQFGMSRRKDHQVVEPSATGEEKSSSRGLSYHERRFVKDRETSPPEQPHVAFQSPLLEYSSALGLGGDGLSPNSQPSASSFPRAIDTPRLPLFPPPHPPSTLSEAYRSPYGEPHHYYGTRNLLDPNMAYCKQAPPFLNDSCYVLMIMPSSEATTVDSQVRIFHSEKSRSPRDRIMSYRDALKQQIQEQQEQRRKEREEAERYEAQLEMDMKNHQPWGRGGGGAPLRDSTGNLIADLNQMHKLNEEAYINPEQWQRRATATTTARRNFFSPPPVIGFAHVQTPLFARGNVFANQPSQQQLQEQDKYKAYLKQQIDEKMRKKAEERERTRLEEEKEERRLAEQRARIQKEYEEEQERKKRKEMEQKAKNEELIQLAEQKRKDAERKKKEAEEKENAELRRQYERERQARVEEVYREPSPPIPTLQRKHGLHQYTPRPPTVDSLRSPAPLSERSLSGLQSPPVPACRNQLRAAGDQHNVFSELSALRRQLRSEQKRLEGHLQQGDWEELDSPLSDRFRGRTPVDVFDMARLKLQAPVRRPTSRNAEPRNLLRIHDSLQLKYTDGESRLGFSDVPKLGGVGTANRRRQDFGDPHHQFTSQRSTVQDDYLDLSPPRQNNFARSSRGSLLESESAFIDPLGDTFPVPCTPELEKTPLLSARERRRVARETQRPLDQGLSCQPFGKQDDYRGNRRKQEAEPGMEGRSQYRTRGQRNLSCCGSITKPADPSDENPSPPRFSFHKLNHQRSSETAAMDPWTLPGTSDTGRVMT
ncbi:centrosome and spindle pole associated protein 1-like isoform X1 [Xyrichtys novacula]|uniref:Centrosome and spindle pole associated protein 1-like isoform X1 n=1 Tax=Xyrichtys novacula TaxID=13765 RepID=A0AAV1F9V6_XYRNO|nr:centrosome and spindle pole associated protein 1-like isoform X1 [Xyrichtys novacula]